MNSKIAEPIPPTTVPSSTVMIENFPEKKGLNPKYDISLERTDAVIAKTVSDFKNQVPKEEV